MSLVHTTLIVILFCIAIPALAQDTGLDRGMSVSRDYLDKYGNRDAIDQLIINPMMGGEFRNPGWRNPISGTDGMRCRSTFC
jgi:hypothetical protein